MLISGRVIGCLVGAAIGDALGAAYEGMAPDRARALPRRGRITDDTQLTLATCEAIVDAGSIDVAAIAARYAAWFREGRISGAGASTAKALRDLAAGAHWALAGARGEYASGAGAAMRVAPLAFLLDPRRAGDRTLIRDFCRITHHSDEAYAGALAIVCAIRASFASNPGSTLELIPDSVTRDRLAELVRETGSAQRLGNSGYVADVVPRALSVAESHHDNLEACLTAIVRAGGDTDTVGGLGGAILGARLGIGRISRALVDTLEEGAVVTASARSYAAFVEQCP